MQGLWVSRGSETRHFSQMLWGPHARVNEDLGGFCVQGGCQRSASTGAIVTSGVSDVCLLFPLASPSPGGRAIVSRVTGWVSRDSVGGLCSHSSVSRALGRLYHVKTASDDPKVGPVHHTWLSFVGERQCLTPRVSRDPRSTETLQSFIKAIDWAKAGRFTQQDIDEAKLSVFSAVDAPVAPSDKGA